VVAGGGEAWACGGTRGQRPPSTDSNRRPLPSHTFKGPRRAHAQAKEGATHTRRGVRLWVGAVVRRSADAWAGMSCRKRGCPAWVLLLVAMRRTRRVMMSDGGAAAGCELGTSKKLCRVKGMKAQKGQNVLGVRAA